MCTSLMRRLLRFCLYVTYTITPFIRSYSHSLFRSGQIVFFFWPIVLAVLIKCQSIITFGHLHELQLFAGLIALFIPVAVFCGLHVSAFAFSLYMHH